MSPCSFRATNISVGIQAEPPAARIESLTILIAEDNAADRLLLCWRQLLAEGRLIVLGSLELEAPKTKDFLKRLDSLGVSGEKVLLVDGLENLNLHLASRNRPDVKMIDAGSLNAYEVLNHRWIVASEPSVRSLAEVLS